MYVITFDRHTGDDINGHNECGVFDIDDNNKRIYRKHRLRSDSKRTAAATTSNTNKRRG
jgi:hypothetical protein